MEYDLPNWGKKANSNKLEKTTGSTYIVRLIVLSKYTPFIEIKLKRWFNRRGIRRMVELDWWESHGQEKFKITEYSRWSHPEGHRSQFHSWCLNINPCRVQFFLFQIVKQPLTLRFRRILFERLLRHEFSVDIFA